jgi:hypothetical protein
MLHSRVALSLVLLGGSIVVPGVTAVNGDAGYQERSSQEWSDGSPMPIPKPTGGLIADGSPMPIPKPTLGVLLADGSPMPIPKPTGAIGEVA